MRVSAVLGAGASVSGRVSLSASECRFGCRDECEWKGEFECE